MLTQQPRLFPQTVPSPAAGTEFVLRPQGQGGILVQSIAFAFTASIAVANRIPRLVVSDGTTAYMKFSAPAAVVAAGAPAYQAYEGAIPSVAADGLVTLAWPTRGVWLPQGYTLASATVALDVADQYSAIVAYVLEIPSGPEWYGFPFQLIHSEPSDG